MFSLGWADPNSFGRFWNFRWRYGVGFPGALLPLRISFSPALLRLGESRPGLRGQHAVSRATPCGPHAQFLWRAADPRLGRRRFGARTCIAAAPSTGWNSCLPPAAARRHTMAWNRAWAGARISKITNRRVAVVGLGAGTLAAYGRSGDLFRFYEINPAVIRAATESFDFLRESGGRDRSRAWRWPSDAGSRAAAQFRYPGSRRVFRRCDPRSPAYATGLRALLRSFAARGLLLIHLSNRYLDLSAEVEALATDSSKIRSMHPQPIRSGTGDGGCGLGDCRRRYGRSRAVPAIRRTAFTPETPALDR